jgi:hypothetical protein
MITLLDLCRSYDGGVTALARKMRVAEHRIYKLASGRHARIPITLLDGVAAAFGKRQVMGKTVNYKTIEVLWEAAQTRLKETQKNG